MDDGETTGKTITVNEAAGMLATSPKAVRRRIERGTLRAVKGRDGRVGVLLADVVARVEASGTAGGSSPAGAVPPRGAPGGHLTARELLDRLQAQAEELGRLRALTAAAETIAGQERAETDRLRAELIETRARVVELEAARSRGLLARLGLRRGTAGNG